MEKPSLPNCSGVEIRTTSYFFVNHAWSVDQERLSLLFPCALVGNGDRVEIARRGVGIVDPFTQQRRTVDHVDRELVELIFVSEGAPQIVVGIEPADCLEGERLEAPGFECLMVVDRPFGVDEEPAAHLSGMLVKGRLEGDVAKLAAGEPIGCEALHL